MIFFILSLLVFPSEGFGCSTFMLKKGKQLMFGHNLDSGHFTPGVVLINKRGVQKESRSWSELAYGKTVPNPHIKWVSKYGSITFNKYREFPDGGMNEAGLFIVEMSLAGTAFPKDESKPLFFMMLWMQYVLDNFESVDQVVRSAKDLTIEGWSWHFFSADRQGNSAAIEFLDGKVVVHKGAEMPVPVLVNTTYEKEIRRLKTYKGFGGETPVDLENKKQPAFVQGAWQLKAFKASQKALVDYGFETLKVLGWSGTQWSYLCDPANLKVYYKTKESPKIKTLDFKSFDWSCRSPAKMLNIHAPVSGAVETYFKDYSKEFNRACIRRTFVTGNFEPVFTSHGSTLEAAITRFAQYPESTVCTGK
jgi:choloylglycine hydrolase